MALKDIPSSYEWFPKIKDLPKIALEVINIWGTKEVPGAKSNPIILGWAKEIGVQDEYTNDGIAWCGLTMGHICHVSEKPLPINPLWALNWRYWGIEVKPGDERIGDIYITSRYSNGKLIGGHVGPFLALDKTHFHVFGGNTSDTCMAARFPFEREHWIRRPIYSIAMPKGCKRVIVNSAGTPVAGKLT